MENHTQDEAPAQDGNATEQPANPNLPKWYTNLLKMSEEMSQEDRDLFPPDYTENLDYYLYGMPKKSPGPSDATPPVERNDGMEAIPQKYEADMSGNSHAPDEEKQAVSVDVSKLPNFARNILKIAETIPQEALDEFPPDYSENLDHYLYGMPKKSP